MTVTARRVDWKTHRGELQRLRERVFVDEMGIARDDEWDGLDDDAHHFLASDQDGLSIGTARLLPTGQLGRVAVLADYRQRGIGHRLVAAALGLAEQLGMPRVFLHAQIQTLGFYDKAGFHVTSDEFLEAGIVHREMERVFAIPFEPSPEHRGLGIDNPEGALPPTPEQPSRREHFDSDGDGARWLCDVAAAARRTLDIYSPALDHVLFDRPAFIDALSAFVRSGRYAEVRVVILSTSAILDRGHRLVALMQRLPSKIRLRRLDDTRLVDPSRTYVVADQRALWMQPDTADYVGWVDPNDPVRARQLQDEFDIAYDAAREDPELRTLRI